VVTGKYCYLHPCVLFLYSTFSFPGDRKIFCAEGELFFLLGQKDGQLAQSCKDGYGSPWLWQTVAMAAPGYGSPWLWQPLAMAAPGYGRPWLWQPLAMADLGYGRPWLWQTLAMGGMNPYKHSMRRFGRYAERSEDAVFHHHSHLTHKIPNFFAIRCVLSS